MLYLCLCTILYLDNNNYLNTSMHRYYQQSQQSVITLQDTMQEFELVKAYVSSLTLF